MKRLKTTLLWIKDKIHRPLLLLFSLVLLCCAFYAEFYVDKFNKSNVFTESESITIKGKIRDLEYGEGDDIKTITVGECLCYVNSINNSKSFEIGNTVLIKGNITKISHPENPGEFDSFKYELSKGIKYIVFPESVTVVNKESLHIKSYFKVLNHNMSEHLINRAPRSGGTVSTILLGDKRSLPEARKDLFSFVSLSFFLVISGLHVSFIAALINRVFKGVTGSYKVSLSMTVLFILSYGLLTGFTVSVKRAVIMYFIKALAEYLNKNYDSLSALSFAGIIELISNPFSVYSVSFIYSYSAVFIIGFFYSYVLPDIPKEYFRKRSFEIFKLPFFMMLFMPFVSLVLSREFSFAGMFINLILSLITLPLLTIGMVVLLFSYTNFESITLYLDFCEGLIIKLIDLMCLAGSKLNFLRVTGLPSGLNIILYLITAFTAVYMLKKRFLKLSILIMAVSINLLTHRFFFGPVVTFLSVGQGDSAVIQTGKRTALLIDTGSTSKERPGEYILIPFLKHEGIDRIEKVFLSHGDADHVGGVRELINKEYSGIDIEEVVFPDVGFNETFESIKSECIDRKIKIAGIQRGTGLHNNKINIDCLWPEKTFEKTENENSMVLLVNITNSKKDVKFLFTGDIGAESEAKIIAEDIRSIDVLKVAHHGSKYSTSQEFLSTINPKIAVISCGKNNYGHPAKETLQRLQGSTDKLFITREKGAVSFRMFDVFGNRNHLTYRFFTGTRKLGTTSDAGDV